MLMMLFSALTGCITAPKPVLGQGYKPAEKSVTVMTYNVENLFDTEDDVGKNDEAFLPLDKKTPAIKAACRATNNSEYRTEECLTKNWSEHHLDLKMRRLAHVLGRVKGGKGPDILIMQEVENRRVLEIWRKGYLADMGYKPAILIEGPDERGIDVGVMTRFDVVGEIKLHEIKYHANEKLKESEFRPTRGVTEVTVRLPDQSLLTVMGVHLPSQGAPTETRRQVLEIINSIRAGLPTDRMTLVAGDFNITSEEEAKEQYMAGEMAKTWGVSHLLGCKNCDGTYYYGRTDSWSFFDIMLLSKNMLDEGNAPWKVVPESIRIENSSKYQLNARTGGPSRFDHKGKDGVSDHWPLVLEIVKR